MVKEYGVVEDDVDFGDSRIVTPASRLAPVPYPMSRFPAAVDRKRTTRQERPPRLHERRRCRRAVQMGGMV